MTTPVGDGLIHVVHLVSSLNIGGQEMVILSLVEGMNRSRFRATVLCLHERGPLADRVEAAGVPVQVVGGPGVGGWALVRRLAAQLKALAPDILHTHNPAPHQNGALAKLLVRVPVLIHTKHGRNWLPTRTRRIAEMIAGRLSDLVVPVSADSAEVARREDHVPQGRLRVIRNGIAVPAPVPARAATPSLVHVARLNRVKDQGTLLAAMRLVVDRVPSAHLDIVGDGPARPEVEATIQRLGLADAVTLRGFRDNVRPFLEGARLFVLSSLSEGISITLLEAMAAGLPIVATDVGGNREVIVPGETGLLVPPADPRALAEAMLRLLDDPALAARMGAAGRARVEREFAIERTIADYEAAYVELLARKRRAA